MYLRYGLLADAVVPGSMGKKNIIGTFHTVFARNFPCIHPSLSLAIRVEGDAAEIGRHYIELGFVDADYNAVREPITTQFDLQKEKLPIEGVPAANDVAITIQNLPLPKAGWYEFVVKVNGRHLGSIPLYAIRLGDSLA